MNEISNESACMALYPNGMYELSAIVKSALDREITGLPRGETSEHGTRYPTDATSMRAFLEIFFTRHFFQLQNSLIAYATSVDFSETIQCGRLRILDIGSGPAVASLSLIDAIDRRMRDADSSLSQRYGSLHMTHVLNDTSTVCLATGQRMLTACLRGSDQSTSPACRPQIFALSSAFPGNLHQLRHLASFLGGFDLVILSYVLRPLIENGNLRTLASGLGILEQFCTPRGRMLIIQDKFQEQLVRRLARMIGVKCHEQTLTQEIYPPRGSNGTCTYTYYDCLYAPRRAACLREVRNLNVTR